MHPPTLGAVLTEPIELRLSQDDQAIGFSCGNYDSEPSGIQAPPPSSP